MPPRQEIKKLQQQFQKREGVDSEGRVKKQKGTGQGMIPVLSMILKGKV